MTNDRRKERPGRQLSGIKRTMGEKVETNFAIGCLCACLRGLETHNRGLLCLTLAVSPRTPR
jgi:hypothetical protein